MWATERGNLEMVELLLQRGAEPNLAAKVTILWETRVHFDINELPHRMDGLR